MFTTDLFSGTKPKTHSYRSTDFDTKELNCKQTCFHVFRLFPVEFYFPNSFDQTYFAFSYNFYIKIQSEIQVKSEYVRLYSDILWFHLNLQVVSFHLGISILWFIQQIANSSWDCVSCENIITYWRPLASCHVATIQDIVECYPSSVPARVQC